MLKGWIADKTDKILVLEIQKIPRSVTTPIWIGGKPEEGEGDDHPVIE